MNFFGIFNRKTPSEEVVFDPKYLKEQKQLEELTIKLRIPDGTLDNEELLKIANKVCASPNSSERDKKFAEKFLSEQPTAEEIENESKEKIEQIIDNISNMSDKELNKTNKGGFFDDEKKLGIYTSTYEEKLKTLTELVKEGGESKNLLLFVEKYVKKNKSTLGLGYGPEYDDLKGLIKDKKSEIPESNEVNDWPVEKNLFK